MAKHINPDTHRSRVFDIELFAIAGAWIGAYVAASGLSIGVAMYVAERLMTVN
jgi:hypothetical protein